MSELPSANTTLVRIHENNFPVRDVPLEPGVYTFGSCFDCDVVVIDQHVKNKHFRLHIDEMQIGLEILPDIIPDTYKPGDHIIKWLFKSPLEIGPISFEIRNEFLENQMQEHNFMLPESIPESHRILDKNSSIPARFLSKSYIISGVAVIVIAFSALFAWMLQDETASNTPESFQEQTYLNNSNYPIGNFLETLALSGIEPVSQTTRNGKCHMVFYIKSAVERLRIKNLLPKYADTITAEIYIQDDIDLGADIILKQYDDNLVVTDVKNGRMTIDGPFVTEETKASLSNTIKRDIPGIRRIGFTSTKLLQEASFKEKIVAVWAGSNPYIVLNKDTIIYPGKTIEPGITLLEVKIDYLVVTNGHATKRIEL